MILAALFLLCAAPREAGADTLFLRDRDQSVVELSAGSLFGFENGEFRPISGSFSFSPQGSPPLRLSIETPDSAEPGGFLRIRVECPEALEEISAELLDARGRTICWAARIRLGSSAEGELWAIVLGVPSTLAPSS